MKQMVHEQLYIVIKSNQNNTVEIATVQYN